MTNRSILLIEDSPSDEALILRALQKHGFAHAVHVARDGAEGLDYLFAAGVHSGRNACALPGVVFLDLNLPKIGGHEVLRRIRADARTRHLPVVILSSSDEERDVMESYECGANSYVKKPVECNQFVNTMRQLSTYWLDVNEPAPLPKMRAVAA